jgi:hypothetical protein
MLHSILTAALVALVCAAQPPADEKSQRTPAQQKIASALLYEIYRAKGEAERKGVPPADTGVRIDDHRRALVDVRAAVTPALHRTIRRLGGVILSSSAPHKSTIARIPLLKLETLAADPRVRFIEPAAEATTVRQPERGE